MSRKTFLQFIFGLIAILFLWTLSPAQPAAATPELLCESVSAGNWSVTARWSCGRVPTTADDVIISHNVTVNVNTANIISLTVNSGVTLTIGDGTARTLNVAGNMSIATTAIVNSGANTGHVLNVGGNLTNNGTVTPGFNINLTGNLVNNGTINVGNNNTTRTITVNGSVTNNAGAALQVPTSSDTTHSLIVGGDFTNDGTFNARTDGNSLMTTTFGGTSNQIVSGTGTTTNFNLITVNNTGGAGNNIVEIASTNFAPRTAGGFLTLTNGILRLAGSYTLSNNVFTLANYGIPATAGIWLDNPNVTITGQNSQISLNGSIRITQGTYNIGTGTGGDLRYLNNSSFTMEGGVLNVTGFFRPDSVANTITFNMSGGTITVNNFTSDTTSGSTGSFDISAAGSSFTMSAGTIIIRRENSSTGTAVDYRNVAGTVNITGGTVQFGNNASPSGETYNIGATTGGTNVLPNVVINQTNPPTVSLQRPTVIQGSLTINSGSTFVATGYALTISGDWTNNGTFTTGGTATRMTTFNGTSPQTIGGSSNSVFSSITINSGAHVILPGNPTQVQAAAAGTITNNGTLQQTRTVNNATVQFMTISTDRYRGVDINTVNNLGDVTVTIRGNSGPTCTSEGAGSPNYAFRCFDIAPTNQAAARVTLWATTGEQNGIATANLAVYRFNLGDWQVGTARTTGTGTNSYVFAQGDVPGFSGFLLGNVNVVPTAITLGQMTTAQPASWVGVGLVGLLLLLLTAGWLKRVSRMP